MNKFYILLICLFGAFQINAQTKNQKAYGYINKANKAIEESIDYSEALINFNKAMKLMGDITDKNVASLGARTYFEVHHKQRTVQKQVAFLEKSNKYSKQYFSLATNKTTEDYKENVELYSIAKKTLKKLRYQKKEKNG
jgi:hypothetical protein